MAFNAFRYFRLLAVVLFAAISTTVAQDISFFHLSKSDGLSDNRTQCALIDKNGLLWIGTSHGLNNYDGYEVHNFYNRDYPGLYNNGIVRMICDDKNRIWIQCRNGLLSLLDEKRKFHKIYITSNGKKVSVDYLLPFMNKVMFINNGIIYSLQDEDTYRFAPVQMKEEPLLRKSFLRINRWDKNNLVFSGDSCLFLFDIERMVASDPITVPCITAVARLSQNEAIVTTSDVDRLCKIDLESGKISKKYRHLTDQYGEQIHMAPGSIYHLDGHRFFITSSSAGAYVFDDSTEKLWRYMHLPINNKSIASNSSAYIYSDSSGFFFITTPYSGLDYFKLNTPSASTKTVFQDKNTRHLYDGYVSRIVENSKGTILLKAKHLVLKWDPDTDETFFHSFRNIRGHEMGIRLLFVDKRDRLWLGTLNGIVILDSTGLAIKHISWPNGNILSKSRVNKIFPSVDGPLWVCTTKGICFIDPETFRLTFPDKASALKIISGKNCKTLFFHSASEVWIGTSDGAYQIDLFKNVASVYSEKNGLLFNEAIGVTDDKAGNIYIATRFGFHILKAGNEILAYSNIDNVWPIDCHSLIKDKSGNIWFANRDYLACYNPSTRKFKVYDDRSGINNSGFRFYAVHLTQDGKLIFGTNKGIVYFDPNKIEIPHVPISVMIHGLEAPDSLYHISGNSTITLPFSANIVGFSFSVNNLLRNKAVFYRFMLEGADKSWIQSVSGRRVNYSNLKPGNYRFRVKASIDNLHWIEAHSPVAFYIRTPWWRSWWFIGICLMITTCLTSLKISQRNRKIRQQKEQLETEKAINYLSNSIYEQGTIDAILWDVAKNCIGRLNFVDCVIYMKDEDRNVLIQKAAWGPKSREENMIISPIEIPLGKGLVGSVAQSAQAEIISDTSKDSRYIVDDKRRLSEITVPIIFNGRVLGIIDSEHPRKNFFTQNHLSILHTISSLCANKIIRLKAEEDSRKSKLELLKHERETVEAQLKSLRLQMNPHFLFNSLNSIQQMILSGEDTSATLYLSKFSRLLRLVLLHSDKETVTLKEELETLGLYVSLESLRFKEAFQYHITCNDIPDPREIQLPVMLIQPFAENAILHGLLPKNGKRCLSIDFSVNSEESLVCIIEDNGIGRNAARKINNARHSGKGITVAQDRINLYNEYKLQKSNVFIEDMHNRNGTANGTRVTLVLPLL